jgi:phosphoglycolate phosphatase
MRVMHIAPERGLYNYISTIENVRYELFDLNPEKYTFAKVTRLDLVTDLVAMPSRTYDVVMHSHVMEHVLGNVTAVLFHLHRLLKDDGEQFCIIPLMSGHYSEDLGPLPKEERTRRFGQFDHVRRFGREQAKQTVGMLFKLPEDYDLEAIFDPALLDRHNIPAYSRKGLSPDTVLRLKKSDLLLRD